MYLKEYPTEIFIRHIHNHIIPSIDSNPQTQNSTSKDIENNADDWCALMDSKQLEYSEICDNIKGETELPKSSSAMLNTKIDQFCDILKMYLREKPDIFYKPIDILVTNFCILKSESEVLNAICALGKYISASKSDMKTKKKRKSVAAIHLKEKNKTKQSKRFHLNKDHMYSASMDV